MRSKSEMLAELTTMLRDVLATRSDNAAYARLARAHGYVDGYMRALLESGAITRDELLSLIAQERQAAGAAVLLARSLRLAAPSPHTQCGGSEVNGACIADAGLRPPTNLRREPPAVRRPPAPEMHEAIPSDPPHCVWGAGGPSETGSAAPPASSAGPRGAPRTGGGR
jgi:hypothetical protein